MSDNIQNIPLLNDESIVYVCPSCQQKIAAWVQIMNRVARDPWAPYHSALYRENYENYVVYRNYMEDQILSILEKILVCVGYFSRKPSYVLQEDLNSNNPYLTNAEITYITDMRASYRLMNLLLCKKNSKKKCVRMRST
ncbi:hypothetical protein T10_873 [Trichinella papuae]|uniref:Uncharacterized protein n=1 Tax=Trichinella papuae TaxID=268474 RepID=A0A0V1N658_9BILA|nr:hypothetical protein T10_873 [Trichinella papuae]